MTESKILNIGCRPAVDFIAKELGNNLIGAEIGVNKGHHTTYICDVVNPKILYLIDPWSNLLDPDSGEIIGEAQFIEAKQLLSPFSYCKFIRDYSYNAVKTFDNESLDFVYIDSEHTNQAIFQEIMQWYPKVKKGGIVSGHDFQLVRYGVIDAFEKLSQELKINMTLVTQDQDFWFKK